MRNQLHVAIALYPSSSNYHITSPEPESDFGLIVRIRFGFLGLELETEYWVQNFLALSLSQSPAKIEDSVSLPLYNM